MTALISKIPWAWSTLGGLSVGWLGGWPGESEDQGSSLIDTLFNIGLVVIGGIVAVFAVRKLSE